MYKKKPIKFGYKVWCLNIHDGYLVAFDLYRVEIFQGNVENEREFIKCGAIVLKNIDCLHERKINLPYNIYFDDLFTLFPLLKELADRNYGATGTIRKNRCEDCPIKSSKQIKKEIRGTSFFTADTANNILVCKWMTMKLLQ